MRFLNDALFKPKIQVENVQNLLNLELHKYRGFMHPSWPFWSFSKGKSKNIFETYFWLKSLFLLWSYSCVRSIPGGSPQVHQVQTRFTASRFFKKITKMHNTVDFPYLDLVSSPSLEKKSATMRFERGFSWGWRRKMNFWSSAIERT